MKKLTLKVKLALAALLAVLALGGVLLGSYIYVRDQQISETELFSKQLRDGLVTSCEGNGNPLRVAVIGMLRDEIEQSHRADLARFFPQIPPAELEALIEEQNERRREVIRTIQPVDCEALYPSEGTP